jgi:hypothetical protein
VTATTARWGLAAVLAVGLLAGCSQNMAGAPSAKPDVVAAPAPAPTPGPTPAAGADGPAAASSAAAAGPAGNCRVAISGRSVRTSGGGRAMAGNGAHAFACHDGPLVRVDGIQNGGALLTAEGEKQVSVPQGATVAVGPYQVTTVRIDGADIEFEVAGPG